MDVLTGDKAFNDNIITVTAAKANSFTKNGNDGFYVQSDAIAIFSDLAMYNEDTTLSASGWNINSAWQVLQPAATIIDMNRHIYGSTHGYWRRRTCAAGVSVFKR